MAKGCVEVGSLPGLAGRRTGLRSHRKVWASTTALPTQSRTVRFGPAESIIGIGTELVCAPLHFFGLVGGDEGKIPELKPLVGLPSVTEKRIRSWSVDEITFAPHPIACLLGLTTLLRQM